ncbi:MAG: DUF4292 domain-containing protein [Paludibacteraceae bacterium]|nr:DUF4292 domain-containing protein [Paludibacteraceae bacterium]
MRRLSNILILCCLLVLAGCSTQKKTVSGQWSKIKETKPTWHTCVISGAKAVVTTSGDRTSAAVTMQVVHDSLIIVSIMPTLGIEMARLEATPTEIVAFDKVYNRYAVTTYEELNQRLTPKLTWQQLEQICSAELPTGDKTAKLTYSIGKESITFDIRYAPRKLDVPVKMNRLNTRKYRKMDISQWL